MNSSIAYTGGGKKKKKNPIRSDRTHLGARHGFTSLGALEPLVVELGECEGQPEALGASFSLFDVGFDGGDDGSPIGGDLLVGLGRLDGGICLSFSRGVGGGVVGGVGGSGVGVHEVAVGGVGVVVGDIFEFLLLVVGGGGCCGSLTASS